MKKHSKRFSLVALVAMICLMILSCARRTTELTSTEVYETTLTKPIQKVLVVGVSDNIPVRTRYENHVKDELKKNGVYAVGSLEVLPATEQINREAFEKYFANQNIDAVLVTRLVDEEKLAQFVPGDQDVGQPMAYDPYNYYSYYYHTYDRVAEPGHFDYARLLRMQSRLFSVEAESLMWQCESKSFDKNNAQDIIDELSKLLVEAMVEDGVID